MLADQPSRPLHRNMRWLWVLRGVVLTVIMTVVVLVASFLVSEATERSMTVLPAVVVAVVGLVLAITWALAAWRRWRWDVTELALTLHHGVVTHKAMALPFFRIQHIDANQGPLDRALGMSSLQVHTASISAHLPGIDATEAADLRKELLARAARAAAEANTDGSLDAV